MELKPRGCGCVCARARTRASNKIKGVVNETEVGS